MCHACLIEFKIIHIIMGFKVTQTYHILITSSEFEACLESANGIRQTCGWQCWPTTQQPPSSSTWFPGWWHPYWGSPEFLADYVSPDKAQALGRSSLRPACFLDLPMVVQSGSAPELQTLPYPRLSVWLQEHTESCHRRLCLFSPSSAPGNPHIQEQKTRSSWPGLFCLSPVLEMLTTAEFLSVVQLELDVFSPANLH